jgi:hypothetical protein
VRTWLDELPSRFGPQADAVGKYSQSYQDSLLDFIFENLAPPGELKTCVEFGFNSEELLGGSGANVARLVVDHEWKCWLFDAENENPSINLFREHLTPDNITQVFDSYGIPRELGYISIDVDSIDYWLFAALLRTHRPLVFSVEYNSSFKFSDAITLRTGVRPWNGTREYGSSLRALVDLGEMHGYECIWVVPFLDAFFVDRNCFKIPLSRTIRPLKLKDMTDLPGYKVCLATDLDNVLNNFVRVKPATLIEGRVEVQERALTRSDGGSFEP